MKSLLQHRYRWPVTVGAVVTLLFFVWLWNSSSDTPADFANTTGSVVAAAVPATPPKPDIFHEKLQPFLGKYCNDCHSGEDAQAGIDFTKFPEEDSVIKGAGRKHWEKTLGMLKVGAMPPSDMEQPPEPLRLELAAWLEDRLFNLDCQLIDDPGRVTIRRLNRTEYNNTIRDLLGVDFHPASDFPSDDVGYGFDNIGDVLSLSPLLMEKYLDAAEAITSRALPPGGASGKRKVDVKELKYDSRFELTEDGFIGVNSRGQVTLPYEAEAAGEYIVAMRAKASQIGDEQAKVDVYVDSKKITQFDVKGPLLTEPYRRLKADWYEVRLTLTPGRHLITADFVNDLWLPGKGDRNVYFGPWEITAPVNRERLGRVIAAWPENGRSVKDAARMSLEAFLPRAFRRPPTAAEVERYLSVVDMATTEGESYEQSMQYALQAILVSPSFLFRIETDQKPDDPFAEHPVTDYELASRLSYFLWSSMPDQELFEAAARGQLRDPARMQQQTARMLKDPKALELVRNFGEQWLNLRSLDEVNPDPAKFPGWDQELRDAMKQESLLLFESVLKDDRSVLDFLDADFTFVNGRLARHYGIRNVTGSEFRRVSLNPKQRAGVLTHASILTLTSNPDRTSPVKRGKWILENILGESPPPPPPNVPELEKTQAAKPDATLREQLQQHRADPGCASCHTTMDALGFGFENFDAVGVWRDQDGRHAVDASGSLPSGESFNGPTELVRILKGRSRQFSRSLTEKMLTYALGRGLEYYDRCAVDEILKRMEQHGYRMSELITGIVLSKPFLTRRGDGARE